METQLSNLYQIPHYKAKKECTSVVLDMGCREFAYDYTALFIHGKGVSQMIQKQKAGPLGYRNFLAYTHFSNLDASGNHSRTCPSFSNEDSPRCLRILCCKWGQIANFYPSDCPSLLWGTHGRGELSQPHSTQARGFCCQETGLDSHTKLCDITKVSQATRLVH